jgi:hypothetical protein
LGRLMRWLSERSITPSTVLLQDIEQYRDVLMTDALLGKPEQSWAATRQSWERMRVGELARMIALANNKNATPEGVALQTELKRSAKVVAGARFELTTFRL